MIYTSYYSSFLYKVSDGVSIARYCPFWGGEKMPELYPTDQILNWWKSLTPEQQRNDKYRSMYIKLYYRDVLSKLNPWEVAKKIQGKTLLCFEKVPDFCHRHIVRVWLNMHNIKCEELLKEAKK